jgi:hypothetical protein
MFLSSLSDDLEASQRRIQATAAAQMEGAWSDDPLDTGAMTVGSRQDFAAITLEEEGPRNAVVDAEWSWAASSTRA